MPKEDIFKPTIGNESVHNINNDNGVGVANFAIYKNLTVKNTMFPIGVSRLTIRLTIFT
jgi:hypothetical protein